MKIPHRAVAAYTYLLLSFSLFAPDLSASTAGYVEQITMPAWVVRNGERIALKPGDEILSEDELKTGKNARILLRTLDESYIKLGGRARLRLNNTQMDSANNLFSGFIDILKGAFRFTTTQLGRQVNRKLDFKIRNMTAGIRGTDIWGKSTDEKNILCLIEGKVEAQQGNNQPVIMDKPLTFYTYTPSNKKTSLSTVDEKTLSDWAVQTEQISGTGVLTKTGEWAVNLMSSKNSQAVNDFIKIMNSAGYAVAAYKIDINGQRWERVQVRGFETESDARYFSKVINGEFGIVSPFIVKF